MFCPSATFSLQHGSFVPRKWLATKGLLVVSDRKMFVVYKMLVICSFRSLGRQIKGTFSNADFCDGDGDRKSNLFPVDVLHFGGKPLSLRADVRTASFPLSTKRRYIFCFRALNIYHFFLIWFPKASKRTRQYIIGI